MITSNQLVELYQQLIAHDDEADLDLLLKIFCQRDITLNMLSSSYAETSLGTYMRETAGCRLFFMGFRDSNPTMLINSLCSDILQNIFSLAGVKRPLTFDEFTASLSCSDQNLRVIGRVYAALVEKKKLEAMENRQKGDDKFHTSVRIINLNCAFMQKIEKLKRKSLLTPSKLTKTNVQCGNQREKKRSPREQKLFPTIGCSLSGSG